MIRDTVQPVGAGNGSSVSPNRGPAADSPASSFSAPVIDDLVLGALYEFMCAGGRRLRSEYGLFTRVMATIPLRRVQTLTIRETPLQRLVKRMSIRVDTAGGTATPEGGPKQPREALAPIIRRDAVPALVREVLPGIELDAIEWLPCTRGRSPRAQPAMLIALAVTRR